MAVDAGDAAAKSHETPGAGSPDAARTRRTPLGPSAGARLCDTRTLGLRNWGWIHFCCKPPSVGSLVTTASGHGHSEPCLSRTSWVPGTLRALHTKG